MPSVTPVTVLEFLVLTAAGLASFKLWYTGLFRKYKALFAFLVFRCVFYSLATFWFTDIRSGGYLKFWVVTQPIAWLLSVLILLELYTLVLEKHKGLASLGRWFQYAGLSLSILISGLALLPQIRTGQVQISVILAYYYAIERGVDFSLLIFLVFILVWLTRYPVPISRNVLVHSVVYATMFFSSTVAMFTRVFLGFQLSRTVSTIMLGILAACLLVWLVFLSPKGEEVRVRVPRLEPEQEQRILDHLEALNRTLLKVSRQ
ncbi:MAG: hypothetical protein C5B51_03410 [Terriglobia bacterium]|nr:MAG: hypothetical protein C5B51_03410 [Terriglobia bacterium]